MRLSFPITVAALAVGLAPAAPAASVKSLAAGDDERITCQRIVATGSMMAETKLCRPESLWERPDDLGSRKARDYREEQLLYPKVGADQRPVQVGSANWDKMPALKAKARHLPYSLLVEQVETILRTKECAIPGQSHRKFDIEVPYAVMVEPDGQVSRVLVGQMNCNALESLVGATALARGDRGDFEPTGEAKARWFKGRMNFTLS